MIVLYIIGGLVLLFLIAAALISKKIQYAKLVHIQSDIDTVWNNVSSLTAMDKWSPWHEKDPSMQRSLTGTDGTVGARQSWVSSVKNVGEGSQEIERLDPPKGIYTKLRFIKPFKSEADAYVILNENNNGVDVTWGFDSSMPYPMNIMKLFMNFEKNMDAEFGSGLNKLKALCENEN